MTHRLVYFDLHHGSRTRFRKEFLVRHTGLSATAKVDQLVERSTNLFAAAIGLDDLLKALQARRELIEAIAARGSLELVSGSRELSPVLALRLVKQSLNPVWNFLDKQLDQSAQIGIAP